MKLLTHCITNVTSTVPNVGEDFFPLCEAPRVWLLAAVVDRTKNDVQDEEHRYIKRLSDGGHVPHGER